MDAGPNVKRVAMLVVAGLFAALVYSVGYYRGRRDGRETEAAERRRSIDYHRWLEEHAADGPDQHPSATQAFRSDY